jgi:hypothetical protein
LLRQSGWRSETDPNIGPSRKAESGIRARRELKLRYSIVDYREFEIEHNVITTFDSPKSGKSNNQFYNVEWGLGPLPNYFVELEHEIGGTARQEHHLRGDDDRELSSADAHGEIPWRSRLSCLVCLTDSLVDHKGTCCTWVERSSAARTLL